MGLGSLEWDSPGLILSLRQQLLARFIRQFAANLAYSSHGAEGYVTLRAHPDAVFVARNPISNVTAEEMLRRVDADPRILTKWRHENGFSEKPMVLSLGRLIAEKKVDELMCACAALADRCDLMIIGDGPDLERLQGLAADGMPNVKFMGHQTGDRLGYCVAATDLFVLPGPGGLAVQEAMSYGKPVIASLSDGTQKDLIEEGKNGFMFQSGDFGTMRELIARCLEDRDALTAMGEESRRIVAERFSFDAMQDSFLNAVEFAKARVAASRY
jgi:glycosyltransferase involved in cell wall biosynthesis